MDFGHVVFTHLIVMLFRILMMTTREPVVIQVSSVFEPSMSNSCTPTFTPEHIELFETRFKEGYNIYSDKDYVAWLEFIHPQAAPSIDTATSLLNSFSHVAPASPLLFSDPSGSDSSVVSASHVSPSRYPDSSL